MLGLLYWIAGLIRKRKAYPSDSYLVTRWCSTQVENLTVIMLVSAVLRIYILVMSMWETLPMCYEQNVWTYISCWEKLAIFTWTCSGIYLEWLNSGGGRNVKCSISTGCSSTTFHLDVWAYHLMLDWIPSYLYLGLPEPWNTNVNLAST